MSCYVVSDETINKIVTYIGESHMQYSRAPLIELGYVLPLDEAQKKLAQDMLDLNVRSYDARYPYENQHIKYKIRFKEIHINNHHRALMTLKCFLYQSCEGKCDKEPLYQALDNIAGRIAINIVKEMPEYLNCTWG